MAGLSAARRLAESGMEITVLEARQRVGGRIHTVREGAEVIRLGAEFTHGRPPELWSLINEARLETYKLDGPDLCFEAGTAKKCDGQHEAFDFLDSLKSWSGAAAE